MGCFRPPSVSEGTARLRLTARADLSPEGLSAACDILTTVLTEHWRDVASSALAGAGDGHGDSGAATSDHPGTTAAAGARA